MYAATVEIPSGIPPYTVHQYLYGYFPQHPRTEPRPFLFRQARQKCLLVSRIRPACPHTEFRLETGRTYPVEGLLVPVRKTKGAEGKLLEIPLTTNQERRDYLMRYCAQFGAQVGFCQWFNRDRVQFRHSNGHLITLYPAQVKAMLMITDMSAFSEMLLRGIGRGKAFGYGLLVFPEVMFGNAENHG